MNVSSSIARTPAEVLLDILNFENRIALAVSVVPGQTTLPSLALVPPTDADANKAVMDVLDELISLDAKHLSGKKYSDAHLIGQVFKKDVKEKDLDWHLKYHLRVALQGFRELTQVVKGSQSAISYESLKAHSRAVSDYIFGLLSVLPHLQRDQSGWRYFSGGSNPGINSWEAYVMARGLAQQSSAADGVKYDHKMARITSIFVLRQAMELRFERLISVYPFSPDGSAPKFKHGFHQAFIVKNASFFQTSNFKIQDLKKIYDWCSEIVHQAYQPLPWLIDLAFKQCQLLLGAQSPVTGQAWSINGKVRIDDVVGMQTAFERHFLATYGHGTWKFARGKPEALTPSWRQDMATVSGDFVATVGRPVGWKRFVLGLARWLESLTR